ncbi:hypothetical protein SCUCBS95973_009986 [Sporothrix curviconia]|uniref:Uncharacterized protein n=1 Tax=Sporothrix curviconia TaxID=1260050 RepID=A0ABP0CZG1_9PEZI
MRRIAYDDDDDVEEAGGPAAAAYEEQDEARARAAAAQFTSPYDGPRLPPTNPAAARPALPELEIIHVRDRAVLQPFVHATLQQQALALGGGDVLVVRGAMQPYQIFSHRPSYVNALLVARAGTPS